VNIMKLSRATLLSLIAASSLSNALDLGSLLDLSIGSADDVTVTEMVFETLTVSSSWEVSCNSNV
jgi:hypothetical protein